MYDRFSYGGGYQHLPGLDNAPKNSQPPEHYLELVDVSVQDQLRRLEVDFFHEPGADHDTYAREQANWQLDVARDDYAEELANRHANTFRNNGKTINAGLPSRNPLNRRSKLSLGDNVGFQYDVARGVVTQLALKTVESEASPLPTAGEQQMLEKRKKLAVLETLLGPEGAEGDKEGELFKLNEAVSKKRLLKSNFYEEDESGNLVERSDGNFATWRLRALRERFYQKWNQWSDDDGKKGLAKRAAVTAAGGLVLGAGLGVAGAGLAVAGSAVIATRASKALGVMYIEKQAGALKAEAEARTIEKKYAEIKDQAYQDAHDHKYVAVVSDPVHESQLVYGTHTYNANRQAKKNVGRVAVAVVASASAALIATEVKDFIDTKLSQESLADRVRDIFGGYEEKPQILNGMDYPGRPPSTIQIPDKQPPTTVPVRAARHLLHRVSGDYKGRFVSEVYQDHDGKKDGFLHMVRAAHDAITHGDLTKVQPDANNPDSFWYKVTKKGAKKFSHMAAGSSNTGDVLSVLKPYNG